MPEPLGDRAAGGGPSPGVGDDELAELRRLLLGHELAGIDALQKRLDDPAVRAAEAGKVLPRAIQAASARGMRDALEPFFDRSFRSSVRKHPGDIADAIYPVIGPAIRISIRAAIREFAESLNQIVEKSASWRAVRWRIEARMTGRTFTEILLTRSLLYSVEQVFLIHRQSGVLLMHLAAESVVVKDADMVSGMFTAIQDFVSDSFTEGGNELETIDVGRYKLWIQYGSKALLVGAVSGSAPVELRDVFRSALEQIHQTLFAQLDTFQQGSLAVFEPARPHLEACLLGNRRPAKRRRILPWLIPLAAAVLLGFLVFLQVRSQRRWDAYVDTVRRQPGIVVVRAEKSGAGGLIAGLKDPKAREPANLAAGFGLDPSQVRSEWQPYLSLNTPYALEREVEATIARVEASTVRFEMGRTQIPLTEAAGLEALAAALARLRAARPTARALVIGHSDEVGGDDFNLTLSQDRAANVAKALVAHGVPSAQLSVSGVGSSRPLRTGGSEWDQAANRSVSLRVEPAPVQSVPGR